MQLGSEVSLAALSLVNPVNIASAVSSTQAPNLRRHVLAAEKLAREFPYQGLDSPKMRADSFARRDDRFGVAARRKKQTLTQRWLPPPTASRR